MAAPKRVLWLVRGFLAATIIALFLPGNSANAQSRIDTSIASPAIAQVNLRRRPLIPAGSQPLSPPNTQRRPVAVPQPDVEPPNAQDNADSATGSRNASRRRVPLDGDLRPLIVPAPVDGTITLGDPVGVQDGGDPTREDGRAAEDIAAFESPPAGFDPGAFSIELSPILDRRPRQLFRFQPYQPVGTRLGSFVLFTQLESAVTATSNVQGSTTERADSAIDIAPNLRLVSNWRNHAVEFNARGLASFHRDFSTEDERNYRLEARGRLDITRRSNIEALVARELTQEARGSANSLSRAGRSRANIVTDTAATTLNHRFNRLSLQLRGAISKIDYAPTQRDISTSPTAPIFVTTDERDYTMRNIALRGSWEFNPQLTVFVEGAFNNRRYDQLQGGVNRSSDGQRWRSGLSFGNGGAYLRGEISIGYGQQDPEAPSLSPIQGFLFDANLAWRPSRLTTVLFTATSDITETTIAGSSGGFSRAAGISVRHALRRNFITTAGINYSTVDYQGANITENTLTASLAGEYSLNRNIVLFGNYNHIIFTSNQRNSDYNTDEVRVGIRLQK